MRQAGGDDGDERRFAPAAGKALLFRVQVGAPAHRLQFQHQCLLQHVRQLYAQAEHGRRLRLEAAIVHAGQQGGNSRLQGGLQRFDARRERVARAGRDLRRLCQAGARQADRQAALHAEERGAYLRQPGWRIVADDVRSGDVHLRQLDGGRIAAAQGDQVQVVAALHAWRAAVEGDDGGWRAVVRRHGGRRDKARLAQVRHPGQAAVDQQAVILAHARDLQLLDAGQEFHGVRQAAGACLRASQQAGQAALGQRAVLALQQEFDEAALAPEDKGRRYRLLGDVGDGVDGVAHVTARAAVLLRHADGQQLVAGQRGKYSFCQFRRLVELVGMHVQPVIEVAHVRRRQAGRASIAD